MDFKAEIEKSEKTYPEIQSLIKDITGEWFGETTIYRTANPDDSYEHPKIIAALFILLGGSLPQWQRLLNWYLLGRSMTAREFVIKIGPTQIHARHIEIQKNAGYKLQENNGTPVTGRVILWQWEGESNAKYKRYWIPERLF